MGCENTNEVHDILIFSFQYCGVWPISLFESERTILPQRTSWENTAKPRELTQAFLVASWWNGYTVVKHIRTKAKTYFYISIPGDKTDLNEEGTCGA